MPFETILIPRNEIKEFIYKVGKESTADVVITDKTVKIGLVGKYIRLHDEYLFVSETLRHTGYDYGTKRAHRPTKKS